MIDRHYGRLAHDGREQAIKLLDALNRPTSTRGRRWTLRGRGNSRPASNLKTNATPKQGES